MSNVTLTQRQQCAWISIDDGKVNAMNLVLLRSIHNQLAAAATLAVPVVIEGRAGIFSAGFDLKTLGESREATIELLTAGMDLILAFLTHPQPILSLCTGHAYPMGAFLLLCSDYRIGIQGDWKLGLNEVAIGMTVPPFALAVARHRLTRPGLARVATGALLNPAQARDYGYLDEVVAAADLSAAAGRVIQDFSRLDTPSYQATKQALNRQVIEEVQASKRMFNG